MAIFLGFLCHRCSFSLDFPSPEGRLCVNNPGGLEDKWHVTCGNYCVTQEVYDKNLKKVSSFFRSCGKGWGTGCTTDTWFVTCRVSCQGQFCSQTLTGDFHTSMAEYGPPTGDTDNNHLGTSAATRPHLSLGLQILPSLLGLSFLMRTQPQAVALGV